MGQEIYGTIDNGMTSRKMVAYTSAVNFGDRGNVE